MADMTFLHSNIDKFIKKLKSIESSDDLSGLMKEWEENLYHKAEPAEYIKKTEDGKDSFIKDDIKIKYLSCFVPKSDRAKLIKDKSKKEQKDKGTISTRAVRKIYKIIILLCALAESNIYNRTKYYKLLKKKVNDFKAFSRGEDVEKSALEMKNC